MKDFSDKISPEQKLVQLTAEHPEYRKNYNFPSYQEGWKVMRIEVSNYMNSGAMLALDCEMVLCHDGTKAVIRVCVVDNNLEVVYYFAKRSIFGFIGLSGALTIRRILFYNTSKFWIIQISLQCPCFGIMSELSISVLKSY